MNVDGSMPGNSLSATGSNSSMKGTMMKTENGTSRNKSDVVRTSCRRNEIIIVFNRTFFYQILNILGIYGKLLVLDGYNSNYSVT